MSGNVRKLLDHLADLHSKATPGPWTAATAPAEGSDETAAEYLTGALRPDEGRPLWVAWAPKVDALHPDCDYVVPVVTGDGPASEANAKYLASVHAALPALLAVVRGVAELAEELEGWRDNAERYSNAVDVGSAVYERSMGRARAYERAIEGLASLLADAAPDTEKETGK